MTQILKWNNNNNHSYDSGDTVVIVSDAHIFSADEKDTSVFTIESGVNLSEGDKAKLIMTDERPVNFSAISQIPTFRSLSTKLSAMSRLHRRKYVNVGDIVQLKSGAQEVD